MKPEKRVLVEVLLHFVLYLSAAGVGYYIGLNRGEQRGIEKGRDVILREAVDCGAAALMCNSATMEVEVLWVTKEEDRKKFQKNVEEAK